MSEADYGGSIARIEMANLFKPTLTALAPMAEFEVETGTREYHIAANVDHHIQEQFITFAHTSISGSFIPSRAVLPTRAGHPSVAGVPPKSVNLLQDKEPLSLSH